MPIKIHWGDNGSYKTAGCVMDDVIPAIKQGRTIITNIRGLSYDRCKEKYPDAPDTFNMINLDLDSTDGLHKCRTWFQWAERGALIVFDETQLVFLKTWKDSDLKQFDYPGGIDQAKIDDRPSGWLDAWTRHRHWNWDVVLTTPNIKYVRQDIRDTSQTAYKHTNYGVLGPLFKKLVGDYKEVMHDTQSNQPPPKAIMMNRRINKDVFDLYESTATGVASTDFAGTSIFKSLPLLLALLVCVLAFAYSFSSGGYENLANGPNTVEKINGVVVEGPTSEAVAVSTNSVAINQDPKDNAVIKFLSDHDIKISSFMSFKPSTLRTPDSYQFRFNQGKDEFHVSAVDLVKMGIDVQYYGDCMARLTFSTYDRVIGCHVPRIETPNDKLDSYTL